MAKWQNTALPADELQCLGWKRILTPSSQIDLMKSASAVQWQPKLIRFDGTREKNVDLEDSYAEPQLCCWVFLKDSIGIMLFMNNTSCAAFWSLDLGNPTTDSFVILCTKKWSLYQGWHKLWQAGKRLARTDRICEDQEVSQAVLRRSEAFLSPQSSVLSPQCGNQKIW